MTKEHGISPFALLIWAFLCIFVVNDSDAATAKSYATLCRVDATTLKITKDGRYYPTTLIATNTKPCAVPPVVTPPVIVPPVVIPPVVEVPPVFVPSGGMPWVDMTKVPPSESGYATLRIQPAPAGVKDGTPANSPEDHGAARFVCTFSHMLNDDPIVYPDQQGKSHLHTFFGNTGAKYNSTVDSIANSGNSTCQGGIANRTSYWVPSMIDTATGTPIKPTKMVVYYKHGFANPIPPGLRMISGQGMTRTTSVVNSWERHQWTECQELYDGHKDNIVPCGKGGNLTSTVTYPDCWNTKELDSADHKSHVAFSNNGACPATHPYKFPTVTTIIHYPVTTDAGTSKWRLSSDMYLPYGQNGGYSSHGDFFMGWQPAVHKTYVDNCINKSLDCHAQLLGDGNWLY